MIRQAVLGDVPAIAPLFDEYRCFYGQLSNLEISRSFLHDRLENEESVIFMAIDGVRVSGFIQLYPCYSSVRARRTFILNDLFVLASDRRSGTATKLIEVAVEFARLANACQLTLSTGIYNLDAQSLYRRLGWRRDTGFCTFELDI